MPSAAIGRAQITPSDPVVAGTYGTWVIEYTAGSRGLPAGASITIDTTPSDSDWAAPQVDDPAGDDYLAVEGPPDAHLAVQVVTSQTVRVTLTGRPLREGEPVRITYGDRTGGSGGTRAQTFAEDRHRFWIAVERNDGRPPAIIRRPPELRIVAGPPERLVLVLPSIAAVGEPTPLRVKLEDAWGNVATGYSGSVLLHAPDFDAPRRIEFRERDRGVRLVGRCRPLRDGVLTITAGEEHLGLTAASNPMRVSVTPPAERLLWGDPHGGQVIDPAGIPAFFRHARDVAGLDFAGYQRNDHAMTDRAYRLQQQAERRFDQPGVFCPLPGYEWSGDTARGGHHNIYFRRHGLPARRSGWQPSAEFTPSDRAIPRNPGSLLPLIRDAYAAFRGTDTILTPHVGGSRGNLDFHEPGLEPAVEIASGHGTFEWFFHEALEHRYQVGVVGGSDSHTGRPGDDRPGFQERRYAKAALTAAYADRLDLPHVFDALAARRCYATSGARIVLDVRIDGQPMGARLASRSHPRIEISAVGTVPLERIELYRWLTPIRTWDLAGEADPDLVRVSWFGASRRTSYSPVAWKGTLGFRGARIGHVEPLRFDSPRSTWTASRVAVAWDALTCGHPAGLLVRVDRARDPRVDLTVASRPGIMAELGGHGDAAPSEMAYGARATARLSAPLGTALGAGHSLTLGGSSRVVRLEPGRAGGPRDATVEHADRDVEPGVNAYWVKVLQADFEMAWSSPVFLDYVTESR